MSRQGALAAGLGALLLLGGCADTTPSAAPSPSPTPAATAPTTAPGSTAPSGGSVVPSHVVADVAGWRLPDAVAREGASEIPGHPGQILLIGGMVAGDRSTARVTRLDLATGRPSPMPSLATPVHDLASGLYLGHPAAFGGGNATEQSAVQVLGGSAWRPATQLPTTRSDLSVVDIGGRTYVIGGYDGVHVPREILVVTPGGGLRSAGLLADGVRYAATAVVGSVAYVFGGEVNGRELGQVQRFDASTHRTKVVANLPRPLGHAVAATVGGRVLLIGGRTAPAKQTAAMWWFDPATNRFTHAGSLPVPTSDAAVATRADRIWVLGGEAPQVTDRVIVVRVS